MTYSFCEAVFSFLELNFRLIYDFIKLLPAFKPTEIGLLPSTIVVKLFQVLLSSL